MAVISNTMKLQDQMSPNIRKMNAELDRLQNNMLKVQAFASGSARELDKMKNNSTMAANAMGRTASMAKKNASAIHTMTDSKKKAIAYTKKLANEQKNAGTQAAYMGRALRGALTGMAIGMAMGTTMRGLGSIKDIIEENIQAAYNLETAITMVAKTVNVAPQHLGPLGNQLQDISTRVPLPGGILAVGNIAQQAGQLQIPMEKISAFTEVIARLGITTNLNMETAAVDLAKFADIMRMTNDQYENLGSTLTHLGNTTKAYESEILTVATRLSAYTRQADISAQATMGLSASMIEARIRPEEGVSAIGRMLNQIGMAVDLQTPKLKKFADVAGLPADKFRDLWRVDAAKGFDAFITGLAESSKRGETLNQTLDNLGIKEIRTVRVLSQMANVYESISRNIGLANDAFRENIALFEESEMFAASGEMLREGRKASEEQFKAAKANVPGAKAYERNLTYWNRLRTYAREEHGFVTDPFTNMVIAPVNRFLAWARGSERTPQQEVGAITGAKGRLWKIHKEFYAKDQREAGITQYISPGPSVRYAKEMEASFHRTVDEAANVKRKIDAITQSYDNLRAQFASGLKINLWDKPSSTTLPTGSEMLADLSKQSRNVKNYYENLKKAGKWTKGDKGIDLIQSLSGGTEFEMYALAAITEGGKAGFKTFAKEFAEGRKYLGEEGKIATLLAEIAGRRIDPETEMTLEEELSTLNKRWEDFTATVQDNAESAILKTGEMTQDGLNNLATAINGITQDTYVYIDGQYIPSTSTTAPHPSMGDLSLPNTG